MGVSNRAGIAHWLPEFLRKIDRPELFDSFPANSPSITVQVDAFLNLLDRLTIEHGKRFWVEKTPQHLYYIDEIEKYVKGARFVHIVRSGPDVVASYYDAGKKHPQRWGYFTDSLDRCINAWNKAIPITLQYLGNPNHMAVSYEQLVADTPTVMEKVCAFLDAEYDPGMLERYARSAEYVSAGEPWKAAVSSGISAPASKFNELFTAAQRQYVLDRLIKLDSSRLFIR